MKLIIDIPEEDRKDIGNIHFVREDLKFKIGKAIMNGTPLDDVKVEIEEKSFELFEYDVITTEEIFEIIDNIGKAESEE